MYIDNINIDINVNIEYLIFNIIKYLNGIEPLYII
jgi:hypothetical protein